MKIEVSKSQIEQILGDYKLYKNISKLFTHPSNYFIEEFMNRKSIYNSFKKQYEDYKKEQNEMHL